MVAQQAREAGWIAAEVVDEVAGRIQEMHHAVARRPFRATGPLGAPVRVVHDAITRGVYAAVRTSLRAAGMAGGAAAGVLRGDQADDLGATRRGNLGLAILNGVLGDQLDDTPSLAIPMAVRCRHRDVPLDPGSVRQSFPDATGRVAVFVHGLCENEDSWYVRAERHHGIPEMCLSDRLRADHGLTGVHVRYNTGRHVSENGRDLAALLAQLVAQWPVPVEQLVLIGHSMGGLVIRSAEHVAAADAPWLQGLTHVVCLGTPHRGAPLEKVVHVGTWAMARVPEARPIAGFLDRRSAGIKDLRFGYLRDDDWHGRDPAVLWEDASEDVPFTAGVQYHTVCATLGPEGSRLGRLLGDMLVRLPSASGRVRRGRPLHFHGVDHLPDADHFDLLNHPVVHDRVSAALTS